MRVGVRVRVGGLGLRVRGKLPVQCPLNLGTVILPSLRVEGRGSRVKGQGSRVKGQGSRVKGHGLRVKGHGLRVKGLG